jgi:hypothetical protein
MRKFTRAKTIRMSRYLMVTSPTAGTGVVDYLNSPA